MTLGPYQWQIGSVVFGANTQYPVLGVAVQSYNVNNQDYQPALMDTVQMGQDTLQGGPITFTIGVKDNAPMPYIANTLPDDLILQSSKLLTALQKEWKGDDVRLQWGQLKPLIYCNGYGSTRRIYGRPRKFTYTTKTRTSQFYKVTAEYARIDTLTYSDTEFGVTTPGTYTRDGGDAPAWFRVLLTGPMTNPTVTVAGNEIQLGPISSTQDFTIASGVQLEVSSYPWARRIIDSTGINWRTALVGNTRYLSQLTIPSDESFDVSWDISGGHAQVLWRDAYHTV